MSLTNRKYRIKNYIKYIKKNKITVPHIIQRVAIYLQQMDCFNF